MTTWWKRYPERLKTELQAFEVAGIPCTPIQASIDRGVYELRASPTVGGEMFDLIVTYPDHFPFFRFEVRAPDLDLPYHQHAFARTLCLLGRDTDQWSTSQTAAGLLIEQLPRLLAAVRTADLEVAGALEQHQAEPFSDFYPYAPAICHVDSSWEIPAAARFGGLTLGVIGLHRPDDHQVCLSAVVLEVRGERGEVLAYADQALLDLSPSDRRISGRWSRTAAAIRNPNAEAVFQEARELDRGGPLSWAPLGKHRVQVQGILFPEEVAWRSSGDGWVFVVRMEEPGKPTQPQGKRQKKPKKKGPWMPAALAQQARGQQRYYFARAGRAGREDLTARIPELRSLPQRTIAQFGAGCLGAPSSLEFARAGIGELRLLDDDVVDPATVVRWPLGLPMAGRHKVEVLGSLIREHYPYTRLGPVYRHRLGMVRPDGDGTSEDQVLNHMLDGASLVYDATAEFGVQHFLSETARVRGIPYIGVSATFGGWGGRLIRIRPGVTEGCWSCFHAAREAGHIPAPPADAAGRIQPIGCANPTFTGANFELLQVAMQGVRLAVSTLCDGVGSGYPAIDWDVAMVSLRSPEGSVITPVVQTFPLRRHPDCLTCPVR